jgi:SsrA-binding protein
MSKPQDSMKVVASNRKAGFDYFLEDRHEAGLVLRGSEIKSVRAGQVSLREAYVAIEAGEAWLVDSHVGTYDPASRFGHDPRRRRKLLLHKAEIARLWGAVRQKGYSLVPTRLYLKGGRAKLEFALGRGKKKYDKRQAIARRDAEREIQRARRSH